ncbi:MAG: HEAT repeat domain-containing protein [Prevotellaceae bacterium]|jgi:hypothetical protein|nr:HEAT repeat domain-containing protein [Prevotellaceae bacterium]
MAKNILLLFLLLRVGNVCAYAAQWRATVAVVVDTVTYQTIGKDIDQYVAAINGEGKQAALVPDVWQHPDSIRRALQALYQSRHLEGAVFIGDIPVAMTRDAQHLSMAFKMNQARDWKESSIPSDRFYDDFDLQFEYVRQDSTEKLYHYYTLKASSAQHVSSEIYSARIKAPKKPGKDKYQLLSEYLQKVVKDKQRQRVLSHVLYFTGHGYNSESINARVDEGWTLKHHFPFLGKRRGSRLDFINFDTDEIVRDRLLAQLADSTLDVALLHHHGSSDTQYLSETPKAGAPQQYVDALKAFFRAKIRRAKDTAATKQYYMENFDVPESWVANAFDSATVAADSLQAASADVVIADTYDRVFNAKFVMFDACFNGSFHLDDYISGHYIFNRGAAIVAKANTVNALQDMWPNELVGLLNEGVCVGNWAKEVFTLESHLIGDPTFHFAAGRSSLDRDIVKEKYNPKYWRKLLANTSALPDVRALALVKLQNNRAIASDELLSVLEKDADPLVRLEAFSLLKKRLSPQLPQAVALAMNDTYELLRRLGTLTAGKSGDTTLLPAVARAYFNPATTNREHFQLRYAIEQYPYDTIVNYFTSQRAKSPLWPTERDYAALLANLKRTAEANKEDFAKLNDTVAKPARFTISTQRNLCQTQHLAELLEYLKNGRNNELRVLAAETLGWYVYSWKRDEILAFCKQQWAAEQNAAVKNELEKTVARLSSGF